MNNPTVAPRPRTLGAEITRLVVRVGRSLGRLQLTPTALRESAERASGLVDIAPEEIAEPLELLCQDLAEFPPSQSGVMAAWTQIVRDLTARLRVQRLDPKLQRPRRPPIVIVGWYRTGTTFLQNFLGGLPGYAYVPSWRLIEPISDRLGKARARAAVFTMQSITPEMKVLHPVSVMGPQECWLLLAQHMIVDGYAFHWHIPRYEKWLNTVDRQAAYNCWARNLASFESQMDSALVLKDPCHMLALGEIVKAVPDARIIWTHRDPVEAIGSFGSLATVQHRMIYDRYDPERSGRRCMSQIRRYLDEGMAARSAVPEGRLVDVPHTALRKDAVGTAEQLCAMLDLPFDGDALRKREAEIKAEKKNQPRHYYELSQWGLTREGIESALSDYELPTEVGRHPYGDQALNRAG